MKRLLAALILAAAALAAQAGEPRPFVAGSMQEIADARRGRPFILALWSLSCIHCAEELALFGKQLRSEPRLPLVLVSTDSPQERAQIAAMLKRHGLARAENWVFAEPMVERLRFEVDRKWRGELPRTYFFDRDHRPLAFSGPAGPEFVSRWIEENRR